MRKHLGVLAVAAFVSVLARPAYAGDPLKPFVVLILDTSGSMAQSTGSGAPSCGGTDTRLNHAKCAINNIVNSFGDMEFALGRFRETTNGTFTNSCDANLDSDGNPGISFPVPSGGDQCSTQGVYCGDCDESIGQGELCNNGFDCFPYDGTGNCVSGRCSGFGSCTAADREFQLLTPLVDGNNDLAGNVTDGSCGTCSMSTAGADPTSDNEIWGVSPFTFTPLAAVLKGAKLYWLGQQLASDGSTVIWPSNAPGFSPIHNDVPTNQSFIPKAGNPTCDPNPSTCSNSPSCTGSGCCCFSQCRPMITILLTDGAETCTSFSDTTSAAASLLQTDVDSKRYRIETKPIGFGVTPGDSQIEGIAHAGGAIDVGGVNEGFYASNEAELQLAISSILADAIKTEACNGLDDDCDTNIDEDFPDKGLACDNGKLGICRRTGVNVCRADGTGLACNAATGPNPGDFQEVCNNLDDDCDGKIDEDLTGCTCSPQQEQCNNKDDDCDTKVDEDITRPCGTGTCQGTETCQNGVFVGCTAQQPQTETCNGLDDNCDGVADGIQQACSNLSGGFPAGDPRNNPGDPGHVPAPIAENVCQPGVQVCPANVGPPNSFGPCQFEVTGCSGACDTCNGLDDDCDNKIDEDFVPADCSTNCGVGQTVCTNGMISCTTTTANDDPTCDGVDDDCDGNIDEDWVCDNPPNCDCTDALVCNGVQKCINGNEVCQGEPISQESCDCEDNDCDGVVDNGNLCAPGSSCTEFCQCAFPCANSEFPCPLGKFCKEDTNGDRFCIADPCFNVDCPPVGGHKQVCQVNQQGNQGTCVDVCDVTDCGSLICIPETGECKPDDCTTFPDRCSADQNCINGQCVTNPCKDVTCPTDQYCASGNCVDSCADVDCPTGQRCRLGVCETDPCGHPCPFGQACNDNSGECVPNSCDSIDCPQGQWCNPNNNGGTCEDDPCVGTACPTPDQVCMGGSCFDPTDFLPDAGPPDKITTGGGGGCNTTGGGSGSIVLGLGLVLVLRRRRRRDDLGCGDDAAGGGAS